MDTKTWTVYILQCADGTLYTGITTDMERRQKMHETGKGAKYTSGRGPFTLLHTETRPTRGEASKREAEIKRMNKADKLKLRRGI
jgi:putative endonuclease